MTDAHMCTAMWFWCSEHEQENTPIPSMKGQFAMLRHIPQALAWSCTLANGAHTACHGTAADQ